MQETQTETEISPEERAELEGKHGELLVLASDYGEAAFRTAQPQEWQRFIDEMSDAASRGVSLRHLVQTCRVWPERDTFERMVKQRPGLIQSFGNELVEHCGMRRVEVRKK